MHLSVQTDEISLVPYRTTTFEEQERQLTERTSRVSARLEAMFFDQTMDQFRDNTLANAWYSMHPDSLDHRAHFSDEVGGLHLVYSAARLLNRHRVRRNRPRYR